MPMNYSPQSGWMNSDELEKILNPEKNYSGPLNYSYDPQATINAQSNQANEMQPDALPEQDPMLPFGSGGGGSRPPDMSSINRLISQLDATKTKGYQGEQEALKRLNDYRGKMPQGSEGIDLSSLMGLADAWGGSNALTASYKRPKTAAERAAESAGVDEKIASLSGTLSKQEMDALKDKLTGEIAKLHYGQEKSNKNESDLGKFATHVIDKFNGDKAVQKAAQSEDAANNIMELLSSGNPIAYQSIPTYMARLSGEVGNLSESDKKPFGGSQALNVRFEQAYQSAKDGKMTPENIRFVSDLVTKLKSKSVENRENTARRYADQYGRSRSDVRPEHILNFLSPGSEYKPVEKKSKSNAGWSSEKEKRLQELRSRQGAE